MGFRIMAACVAALGLSALWASAQIDVAWALVNSRTVQMEPIEARVRISNHTGRELNFSPGGNARLWFMVEDRPTSPVGSTGQPVLREPVSIPSGESREVRVDLLDGYRIVKGQSYSVTPIVEVGGARFAGRRLSLEVQPGLELLRREYGMPNSMDARAASLRMIHRDRSDKLFVRIENAATGFCLGVYELGRMIRFFSPRLELDGEGVFHVLHQSGPDRFVHSRFDYDGAPAGTEIYIAEASGIALVQGDGGQLRVVGGTAYVEDPDNPGMLVAPALPPSSPYRMTIGELPLKGRPADKDKATRGQKEP
jgi:hypothetical protein